MHLVITFHSTAEAMILEQLFKEQYLPGRLIPVPSSLRAGCGLAWMAPAEAADLIITFINQSGIAHDSIHKHIL